VITPAYSPTATERVLPRMALDFTTGVLDSRITVTRALNTATRTNASGLIEAVNANLPRFDYNPVTFAPRGLLIEETRANLLLNSLLNGSNLSTQIATVTAVSHTLSFYGTGTITLSGAHSATVNGTGAYPNRSTLTFTPIAGALTVTVSGTVQFAQLEIGAFATSFIPTAASLVTRNADQVTMTGTNFSSWYNPIGGSFVFDGTSFTLPDFSYFLLASDGSFSNRFGLYSSTSSVSGFVVSSGATQMDITASPRVANAPFKMAVAAQANSGNFSFNGNIGITDTTITMPTVDRLSIGAGFVGTGEYINGHVRAIRYYLPRLTNAELQAFSK